MMKLRHTELSIPAGPVWLEALQAHAPDSAGLIVIAQTAVGNHRESREAHFAQRLQDAGYSTLIFDLLTRYEENRDPDTRYNTPLLGQRIDALFEWLRHQPPLVGLPIGLVASGTGSAAAVRALAREQEMIDAFVCRGGRPGLAGISPLRQLACPTLMIVGGRDEHLPNVRQAFDLIGAHKAWQTVPGTDEFFREPGTLDAAATLATAWFRSHLRPRPTQEGAA